MGKAKFIFLMYTLLYMYIIKKFCTYVLIDVVVVGGVSKEHASEHTCCKFSLYTFKKRKKWNEKIGEMIF